MGRHTKSSIMGKLHRCLHELGQPVKNPRWSAREKAVADRFARAIVQGRYRYVKETLPDCQSELRRVAPEVRRADDAVAWVVLCRAYDFGLPRWKRFFSNAEIKLLERYAAALAHGKYADITTAGRGYKVACQRAGLGVRQSDTAILRRISARAHAMGYETRADVARLGPDELRVIARFSRALAQGRFPRGCEAVPDCLRALEREGLKWRTGEERLAGLINAGARRWGWQAYQRWSKQDIETVRRFARALASGRYRTMRTATRVCLKSLQAFGRHGNMSESHLRLRLSREFADIYGNRWRPCWGPDEMRIMNRVARACLRAEYPSVAAAARYCSLALRSAELTQHLHGRAVEKKLGERVREIRARA